MTKKAPDLFNFWNELKRRKVVKTVLVYVAVAWAILEAADTIFPRLGLPEWTVTFVLILLIIIFILVIVLTWVYDITPEGIKVTQDLEEKVKKETGETSVRDKELTDIEKQPDADADRNNLQQKVYDLENQLEEARKLSFRTVFPLLVKKLAFPVVIAVFLLLFLIYKQKIVEILGFGDEKREIAMTHNANATIYIEKGDIEAATREVELALASDPLYSYAWSNRAVISYRQGDLNKAVNETLKAISLDQENSRAPYNLAFALHDKEDYRQAILWYKKAISIDSTFKSDTVYTAASSALGSLYNSLGQPSVAIIVLSRAKDMFPGSRYIYLVYKNLGNAYLLQQLNDSALKYLQLANVINPGEPETNLFLARAYESAGQLTRSIEQWQNYIELESDTAKISEAKKHRKEALKKLQETIK